MTEHRSLMHRLIVHGDLSTTGVMLAGLIVVAGFLLRLHFMGN